MSPPEFSIICHSHEGPATHVTWTWFREGNQLEDIDHNTTQLIVDTSRNSVYQNILQVRGRYGGIYRCSITYNKNHVKQEINVSGEREIITYTQCMFF